MARRIITEADVEQWVKYAGVTEVTLQEFDSVTALARDAAYALGLRFLEPAAAAQVASGPPAAHEAAAAPAVPAAPAAFVDIDQIARIVASALRQMNRR